MANTTGSIESKKDFKNTPTGQYKYWSEELKASITAREKWWKKADKIVNRYIGKSQKDLNNSEGFDLNLFYSNTKTLGDMLYGNTPKIDVSRRYAQADDDVGRVAAEVMERLLNLDVANNGSDIDAVLRSALQDRLLPGLGCAKVRYTFETEEVPVLDESGQPLLDEGGQPVTEEKLITEDAPTDYFYWGDLLWGWCRNWAELPWIGFRLYLTKDEVEARWGDKAAQGVKLKKQTKTTSDEGGDEDTDTDSAWMKAEIWEIWDKDARTVRWISLGYNKQLEEKEDPLQLSGFWPVPPFFIANVTTTLYTPTPDFALAQDLYNEIDTLQTRISIITEAVKVAGVYNASADNIKQVMQNGQDNLLIPVENWALFGENGGIAGQIEWMPIADIVSALRELIGVRDSTIQLLQQITGMTDIMRGALDNQYEGVGQTDAKTKFGSVRIQALQDQFARFASDLMQLKAEVISRHFSPETIYQRANMRYSKDEDIVPDAIKLIKTPEDARLRIEIRPESVAMVDYQALKNERTDYLTALGTYMQSAVGMIEADPASKPLILQMLQWGMAGFKGASEIEGILDKAIEATLKDKPETDKPDPAIQAGELAVQLETLKGRNTLGAIQAKAEATAIARQDDMAADLQTAHEAHVRKIAEVGAGLRAKVTEIRASLQADLLMEKAQAQSNISQTQATVEGEIKKDIVEHRINMTEELAKTEDEITKLVAGAEVEIQKSAAITANEPESSNDD